MGIQINQLCNMNMKFAALLLFVGVTSAMWCSHPPGTLACSSGMRSDEATAICCQGQRPDDYDTERGCDAVDGVDDATFIACCKGRGCTGESFLSRK